MADYGVSFAPTRDNAMMGPRNAQLTGVPEATQVISLRLPRVVGARSIAPGALLNAEGGGGSDLLGSALLQTLLRTLGGIPGMPGSLPGGTAGPNPSDEHGPNNPFAGPPKEWTPTGPSMPGGPSMPAPAPSTQKPRIVPEEDPTEGRVPGAGGGWIPGSGPYVPPRRGKFA
jgi:hypothetical protein